MKSRPRSVENRVAEELNKLFEKLGFSKIERIPAPGRTGPDMTWNELKLAVDPKSRKANPKSHIITDDNIYDHGEYITVKLSNFFMLLNLHKTANTRKSSKVVWELLQHLDEWRIQNLQDGVSIIVLHWPNKHIENSVVVMRKKDITRLQNNFEQAKISLTLEE